VPPSGRLHAVSNAPQTNPAEDVPTEEGLKDDGPDLAAWFESLTAEEQRQVDQLAEMSRPFQGDHEAELLAYREGRHPLRVLFALGLKGADVHGLAEAAITYEGDPARELADIEAGRHPLQRRSQTP
jgi:hypothetical protein